MAGASLKQRTVREAENAVIVGPIVDTRLVESTGVFWRSCRYGPSSARSLSVGDADGSLSLTVPPELSNARPGRIGEFLAGRACAGLCLRDAGMEGEVGRSGRAPLWPLGVSGSIAHSNGLAMAVASTQWASVGLDCETLVERGRAQRLAPRVLSSADAHAKPRGWTLERYFTLAFSAKEAAYKAVAAQLNDTPGFHEACVLYVDGSQLELRFRERIIPIRFVFEDGLCITLVTLDH
jgi:enterobactin synthetase component D